MRTGLYVLSIDDYDLSTVDYEPQNEEIIIFNNASECILPITGLTIGSSLQSFQWIKDGVELYGATGRSLSIFEAGTYQAMGYQGQCPVMSDPITIPSLATDGNVIRAYPENLNYTWTYNGTEIDDAHSSFITPCLSGYYSAKSEQNGQCIKSIDSIYFFSQTEYKLPGLNGFDTFYNSNSIKVTTDIFIDNRTTELIVYNVIGQEVYRRPIDNAGFTDMQIDTDFWASGVYIVSITDGNIIELSLIHI